MLPAASTAKPVYRWQPKARQKESRPRHLSKLQVPGHGLLGHPKACCKRHNTSVSVQRLHVSSHSTSHQSGATFESIKPPGYMALDARDKQELYFFNRMQCLDPKNHGYGSTTMGDSTLHALKEALYRVDHGDYGPSSPSWYGLGASVCCNAVQCHEKGLRKASNPAHEFSACQSACRRACRTCVDIGNQANGS